MKFEQARIELVPRSAGQCFDLAGLFCGRYLPSLLGFWALIAVPLCTITYVAGRYTDWGWMAAAVCLWFGSAVFGVPLIGTAARAAFGEPFTLRTILRDAAKDGLLTLKVLALRIPIALASMLCVLPGAWLALWWGFLVEDQVLNELHEQRHDRRTRELMTLEFSDLFVRSAVISAMGYGVWLIAELTVDVVWTVLFSQSLFFGRFSEMGNIVTEQVDPESYLEHIWMLATSDPAVLALHVATGLGAYGVCRLAWFFCYIDLRVRRDCWDLELEILDEARRLKSMN